MFVPSEMSNSIPQNSTSRTLENHETILQHGGEQSFITRPIRDSRRVSLGLARSQTLEAKRRREHQRFLDSSNKHDTIQLLSVRAPKDTQNQRPLVDGQTITINIPRRSARTAKVVLIKLISIIHSY